jgi:hypothetical protein
MGRRLLTGIGFLLIIVSGHAQFDTAYVKKNIRHCADSLTYAFKARNWEIVARYTYPALIGTLGGKQAFIEYIARVFGQSPESAWKKYEAGNILQVVQKGRDIQAIIELYSVIEWQGNRISTTSHLIGESWNGGQFWTFFDSQGDPVAAKQINPNLSVELFIPKKDEKKEPITGSKSNQ